MESRLNQAETVYRDDSITAPSNKQPLNEVKLGGFLDFVRVAADQESSNDRNGDLSRLLRETDDSALLAQLFGSSLKDFSKQDILSALNTWIADIDRLISRQLDEVLHHSEFQKLESTWRGVEYLVDQKDRSHSDNIEIRIFNATWRDLYKDFDKATDFDQSTLF